LKVATQYANKSRNAFGNKILDRIFFNPAVKERGILLKCNGNHSLLGIG
jgi:hypothetical protein